MDEKEAGKAALIGYEVVLHTSEYSVVFSHKDGRANVGMATSREEGWKMVVTHKKTWVIGEPA